MAHDDIDVPLILHKVLRTARLKSVPAGQIILYEGDLPTEVFIIKSGIVKLYDTDEQGNEKILHLARTPALVPFSFFSGMKDPLRWFYATVTDCELYTLPAAELRAATRVDGTIAETLTNTFSSDVHELLVRLSSLGKTNSQDKVLAALKFLSACHAVKQRGDWWRVDFPVNHQLIADLCGITRESTAIVMKHLADKKVIRSPKQSILEVNRERLVSH